MSPGGIQSVPGTAGGQDGGNRKSKNQILHDTAFSKVKVPRNRIFHRRIAYIVSSPTALQQSLLHHKMEHFYNWMFICLSHMPLRLIDIDFEHYLLGLARREDHRCLDLVNSRFLEDD